MFSFNTVPAHIRVMVCTSLLDWPELLFGPFFVNFLRFTRVDYAFMPCKEFSIVVSNSMERPNRMSVEQLLSNAKRCLKKGRSEDAIAIYQGILEKFPNNKRARLALQEMLKQGRGVSRPMVSPNQLAHLSNLLSAGKTQDMILQASLLSSQCRPNAELSKLLGAAHVMRGQAEIAIEHFQAVTDLMPDDADGWNNLAMAQRKLGDWKLAGSNQRRAVHLLPDDAEFHLSLAETLTELGEFEEALLEYDQAQALGFASAKVHFGRARIYKRLGNLDEAESACKAAINEEPTFAKAYLELSLVHRFSASDAFIDQMLEVLENRNPTEEDQIQLGFALFKAFKDINDDARAMVYLEQANALCGQVSGYNFSSDQALFDKIRTHFTQAEPPQSKPKSKTKYKGPRPIFILGMPRSGTSLTEQMLASHSQVFAAGELDTFQKSVASSGWEKGRPRLDVTDHIREMYLSSVKDLTNARYLTDKMPLNFLWIGHILEAIPEARVVHLKRDPTAVCWSIYSHYFPAKGMAFGCQQRDVAQYYQRYEKLMLFWHQRFPGRIVDLDYDALTIDPQRHLSIVLDKIGLPWEDSVVRPQENKRVVSTASMLQVRKEVYTGSSQAWRRFEAYLQPMIWELSQK